MPVVSFNLERDHVEKLDDFKRHENRSGSNAVQTLILRAHRELPVSAKTGEVNDET